MAATRLEEEVGVWLVYNIVIGTLKKNFRNIQLIFKFLLHFGQNQEYTGLAVLQKTDINKILILRFGALGDVVHTTGLFRSLKELKPDLSIHYLTFKEASLLIENDSDLDKVWIAPNKSYKCLISFANMLKKEGFDLFINLQPSVRTRVFSGFLNARKTLTYKKDFSLHAVENFWRTAKPIFRDIKLKENLKLYLSKESLENASLLLPAKIKEVAFIMETNPVRQGRCWPVEHWLSLAESLVQKYDCEIVLTGTFKNIENADKIVAVSEKVKSFCGKLNIGESAALLSRCSLVISGDTGPLHISTALGVPVIGLYGSSPVSRTGPWGQNCYILNSTLKCVPCNRRKCKFLQKGGFYAPCMKDIRPATVLDIIEKNKLL